MLQHSNQELFSKDSTMPQWKESPNLKGWLSFCRLHLICSGNCSNFLANAILFFFFCSTCSQRRVCGTFSLRLWFSKEQICALDQPLGRYSGCSLWSYNYITQRHVFFDLDSLAKYPRLEYQNGPECRKWSTSPWIVRSGTLSNLRVSGNVSRSCVYKSRA